MVEVKRADIEEIARGHRPLPAGPLKVLKAGQVVQIDQMLSEIGPFGEVRLIKVKGRLRFIQRVESVEAQ